MTNVSVIQLEMHRRAVEEELDRRLARSVAALPLGAPPRRRRRLLGAVRGAAAAA